MKMLFAPSVWSVRPQVLPGQTPVCGALTVLPCESVTLTTETSTDALENDMSNGARYSKAVFVVRPLGIPPGTFRCVESLTVTVYGASLAAVAAAYVVISLIMLCG